MDPVYLFDLASRHAQWASVRQAVITGNIANANTPGYEALDVQPFTDVLDQTALTMARTDSGHLEIADASARTEKTGQADSWEVLPSGNSVSLEQELIKADDVNRSFSLDTDVMRAFNRMLLSSVKAAS